MRVYGRILAALLVPVLLSGCLFGGDSTEPRRYRPMPRYDRPAALLGPTTAETQQCFADLERLRVRYSALPDQDFGGGCVIQGGVMLVDIGVPVTGIKSMRCPLARTFIAWVQNGVAPAAREILGSEVVKVETFGTYACRNIVGNAKLAGKISEHATGNAVDVSAFVLADGRRVTVEHGWRSEDPEVQEFVRVIHRSACKRFKTVLSPDYNSAHYNHFHLDMGRGPYCK